LYFIYSYRWVITKTLNMHLHLDLGLMVFIKLEEVLWEPCLTTLLFNLNYGTKDLPTLQSLTWGKEDEDGHRYTQFQHES